MTVYSNGECVKFIRMKVLGFTDYNSITLDIIKLRNFTFILGVPLFFLVFLYVFYWISSGFSSDIKKDGILFLVVEIQKERW